MRQRKPSLVVMKRCVTMSPWGTVLVSELSLGATGNMAVKPPASEACLLQLVGAVCGGRRPVRSSESTESHRRMTRVAFLSAKRVARRIVARREVEDQRKTAAGR